MKTVNTTLHLKSNWGMVILLMALSCPALAHHPMGGDTPSTLWQGLLSGLAHPVIELDHLMFLMGIATATAIAGIVPKQALMLLLVYVAFSALGTVLRVSDLIIPLAETAIAVSLLAIGLWLWITKLPGLVVIGLWASGGLFHGYAYGEAVVGSEATPLIAYLWGLAFIQAVLMAGVYLMVRNTLVAEKNLRPLAFATSSVVSSMALWMLWTAI